MKLSNHILISTLALTLSQTSFAADTTDYDLVNKEFLDAIQMRDSGDIFASIDILEKIIASQPEYKRAELELAVAYFRAHLYSQAKSLAESVLADPNTPEEVKETINVFLTQLKAMEKADDENRHKFEAMVSVGIGRDSNINASPAGSIVNINGIEFTLNPQSVAQEENYGTIDLVASHTYRIPGTLAIGSRPVSTEWSTSVGASRKAYQDIGDYNLDVLTFVTGQNFISQTDWRAGYKVRLDHISLGDSQLALFKGISTNFTKIIGNNEFNIAADLTDQEFNDSVNKGRNGLRLSLNVGVQHNFKQDLLGKLNATVARNDARDDNKQYLSKAVNAGLYYSLSPNSLIYGELGYKVADYNGVEPIYNIARNDTEVTSAIGASYSFKSGFLTNWILNGKINRFNTSSDVSIYEYERTDASLKLSKRF